MPNDAIAMVTGAGAGIGRASALALAAAGARIAVAEIDRATGGETVAAIEAAGGTAVLVPVDVTSVTEIEESFATVDRELGPVSVLVNCAGGSLDADAPIEVLDPDVFDLTIARDLRGTMLTVRSAIPRMRRVGRGTIVNFTSYIALHGGSENHAYVAAKGGVISLTRAIAARYGEDGIRANAIAPGIVLTERVQRRVDEASVDLDAIRKKHPHAVSDPASIARVVLFLAGSDSAPLTGAIVPADGGLTLY